MVNRMVARLEGEGWVVDHEGECGDQVEELFGTRTLPMPFMRSVRASMVVDALQQLNPGVEVVVGRAV